MHALAEPLCSPTAGPIWVMSNTPGLISRSIGRIFSSSHSASRSSRRISISIRHVEGGGCELTLVHEMKPEHEEYRDGSEKGWTKMLGRLAQVLEPGN